MYDARKKQKNFSRFLNRKNLTKFFAAMELFLLTFANLIADGATGLARALARGLTLSATARFARLLEIRLVNRLDVFHVISS